MYKNNWIMAHWPMRKCATVWKPLCHSSIKIWRSLIVSIFSTSASRSINPPQVNDILLFLRGNDAIKCLFLEQLMHLFHLTTSYIQHLTGDHDWINCTHLSLIYDSQGVFVHAEAWVNMNEHLFLEMLFREALRTNTALFRLIITLVRLADLDLKSTPEIIPNN